LGGLVSSLFDIFYPYLITALVVLAGVAWLAETLGIREPIPMVTFASELSPPIVVVTVIAHALRIMLK
jgi:hypothetical protein